MTKRELLQSKYEMARQNLLCYSANYLMTKPKAGFEEEWKTAAEECKLLEEMIKDYSVLTYTIPDKYFRYGKPVITDYLGAEGEGLQYKVSLEEAIELESNNLVVSLLSPWIRGFDSPYTAGQLKLVSVDLDSRMVKVEVIG